MIWLIAGGASVAAALVFRLGQLSVWLVVMSAAAWLMAGFTLVVLVGLAARYALQYFKSRKESLPV